MEKTAKAKNSIDMLNGRLWGKLLLFSLPLMLSGVLQLLFNAVDLVVVGRFAGDESLAAVGSTGALINLVTNLFIGLSVGANVVMAKALGAGDAQRAERTVHTSVLVGLAGGLIVSAVGIPCSRILLELMKSDVEVIDKATIYLMIYFAGSPFSMVYNFGSAILRAKGDTKRPLIFLSIAGVLNAGMNMIFVVPIKMDVAGVALATIISQLVSAALVVICLMRERDMCRMTLKKLRFHKRELIEIIRVGLPTGINSSLYSLSNTIIQSSVNKLGKVAMAGNAAAANIEGFLYTIMNSFAQAATTFTSQNIGAGKKERVKYVLGESLVYVTAFGLSIGLIMMALAAPLASIYSPDPAVIELAKIRMRLIAPTYFTCGIMDVMCYTLRGMGYLIGPMIYSLVFACGLRIVWVYAAVMPGVGVVPIDRSLFILYLCYPVSWIAVNVVHVFMLIYAFRMLYKKRELSAVSALTAEQQAEGFSLDDLDPSPFPDPASETAASENVSGDDTRGVFTSEAAATENVIAGELTPDNVATETAATNASSPENDRISPPAEEDSQKRSS